MRAFFTIIIFLIVVAAAGAACIWFGVYNISARVPHWGITREIIGTMRDRSIMAHSSSVTIIPRGNFTQGAALYNETCIHCHGAPGIPADSFAKGLYPRPANLLSGSIQAQWNAKQFFWIVDNGVKLTGMPAFSPIFNETQIADVVAFVQRLPKITPDAYKQMTAAAQPAK